MSETVAIKKKELKNNNEEDYELKDKIKDEINQETKNKTKINNENQNDDKFNKYKDKGLTGLANLGNTCFMNSTLQCLSHCYELNEFLNKKTYETKLNKNPEGLIIVEWDELRKLMWSENCVISPGGFLANVQKVANVKDRQIFTGFAQNDLPEFLYFIIECFHNGIKRPVNMEIKGKVVNKTDEIAEKCYKMMQTMFKKEYSEILTLFYGIHVSQIKNEKDEIVSLNPEPYFLIHLPIPIQKKNINLYDCFDLYTSSEKMDGDNMWYNEETDEKEIVHKNIAFFSLPNVLVIDLKRFSNNLQKNNVLVDIPLDNLDLSKYIIGYSKKNYVYELFGICNHSGSIMGGHYTAFIKNANGRWYHFNDTMITEIQNTEKIVTPKAYCLFYRKKNF